MSDVTLDQLAEQATRRIRGYLRSPESNEIRIRPLIAEALEAAIQALREQLAVHEADLEAAAGDLLVPLPEPGTDAAKMLLANRLLIAERHTLQQHLAQVTQERDTLSADAEMTDAWLAAAREELGRRYPREAVRRLMIEAADEWERPRMPGEGIVTMGHVADMLLAEHDAEQAACTPMKSAP